MSVATFDTLKFANTLKAAGVPPQQAEAQAVAFAEVIQVNMKDLVTKDDLDRGVSDLRAEMQTGLGDVRTEIRDVLQQITARFDLLEQRLNGRIDTATTKLSAEIDTTAAKLTGEIETTRAKFSGDIALLRWITGVAVFGIVTILIRAFLFRTP